MAVTLTVNAAKLALRIDESETEHDELLTRYIGAARAMLDRVAPGAPEDVSNAAAERVVRYLYDGASGEYMAYGAVLRNSGALGMVSPWAVRRAGKV